MEKLLIIEDERPAFEKLHKYLAEYFDQDFDYDWSKNISEAGRFLKNANDYSLIIADIQLGEENVFDLLLAKLLEVPIIFCTAYNEFLSEAFQTNGIAYILKPYNREELKLALKKYQLLFNKLNQSKELIEQLKTAFSTQQNYKTRFVCKNSKNELQIVESQSLCAIEAEGDFCKLHTIEGKTFVFTEMIGKIENQLDSSQFYRINRRQIIHIKAILKMTPYFKNRLVISINGNDGKFITSSSRTAEFRDWLDR